MIHAANKRRPTDQARQETIIPPSARDRSVMCVCVCLNFSLGAQAAASGCFQAVRVRVCVCVCGLISASAVRWYRARDPQKVIKRPSVARLKKSVSKTRGAVDQTNPLLKPFRRENNFAQAVPSVLVTVRIEN